jgi:hypothetical protein
MGVRMTKMLLVVCVIQTVLVLTGVADIPGSQIYDLFTSPIDWNLNSLISFIKDIGIIGAAGVIIGTAFRNDLLTFAGLFGIFITFGAGLYELYKIIQLGIGTEVAIFIVGPLCVIYFATAVSFWRGQTD